MTRFALGYLLVTGLLVGLWASWLLHDFYADFLGSGRAWVSLDGPYNGHLVRDTGAAELMIAALSGLSLVRSDRAPPFTVGLATWFFTVTHFACHATHLQMYAAIDRVGNVLTFGTAAFCSAWLAIPRTDARPRH